MNKFQRQGQLCWLDMKTHRTDETKRFYRALLGWQFKDEALSGRSYTKIRVGQDELGGLTSLTSPIFPEGTEPHVSFYLAVDDVDQTAVKAVNLGGVLLLEAFDVPNHGRMATIQDPTGAVFSIWETRGFQGMSAFSETKGVPGWFELVTPDLDTSARFYSELFNWSLDMRNTSNEYLLFNIGGQIAGGMKAISNEMIDTSCTWRVYYTVTDCRDMLVKAQSLGVKLLLNTEEKPGRIVGFVGPDGLPCFLIDSKHEWLKLNKL